MMADLVDQHMSDDFGERILAVAPEIEQRPAVEPDHVGQFARLFDRAALGEPPAAKKAEQVEFALGAHLVERLVIGEVDHLNDETLAQAPKRSGEPRRTPPGRARRCLPSVGARSEPSRLSVSPVMAPPWAGAPQAPSNDFTARRLEPIDQEAGALGELGANLLRARREFSQHAPKRLARDRASRPHPRLLARRPGAQSGRRARSRR